MAVHCGDPDNPPDICQETEIEVGRDSPWFDEAFVQAAAWHVSGTFSYSSFYSNSEPTDYELSLRWSEAPYPARLYEYCDGSSRVWRQVLPITAELKTVDGAFDGAFSGQVRFPSGRATYQFDPVPLSDIQGTNDEAASADELACQQPDVRLADLSLDRKPPTGHFVIRWDGEEPLNYDCNGSWSSVGSPRVEQVRPLE